MLADLAFRITAQGAYAREFGNLKKEIANLDAGMSTISRTARITQLSIGALAGAFIGGLGTRAIIAGWRLVTQSVREAASGATDFGGRVTADMIPKLNAAAQAFKGIENAIGGLVAQAAAGLVTLAEKVGLVDLTMARLEAKYGRVGETSDQALKDLQTALAAKAEREMGPDKSVLGSPNRFDIAGQVDPEKALLARAEAARQAMAANVDHAASIRDVVSALDSEIAKLGMTAVQQRIYDELQQAGVSATSAAGQAIAAKVQTLATYEAALKATNERLQQFQSFASSALNTFTGALSQGKTIAEAFRDSWVSALNSIISKINEAAATALASSLFGKGGGLAGIGSFIGPLLGFATGGSFKVGGSGGPDSQFVPLALTPGEVVSVSKGEPGGSAQPVQVVVRVEPSPYFDARVENVAAPVAQRVAVSTVGGYDKATRRARELAG